MNTALSNNVTFPSEVSENYLILEAMNVKRVCYNYLTSKILQCSPLRDFWRETVLLLDVT